ncbi:GntR family transcriptional regulator [Roseobacter weihaiensis]|uniref:GntR family transcriptional regulator n=1 Tax=Roseobacter weihaiensis TaxID=2763262 RepID=UPI001D09C9A9|nr:GntR family transcriptional regulator [Roseobacter sp. H9]
MKPAPEPKSNMHQAVSRLREMIFTGELGPGSDHLETELARRLGMSRTPVREAALTLQAQGLVSVRPRRGVRILAVSPQDMRDIYDVLTELESLAAETAARQGYTQQDLRMLRDAIDAMDLALAANNREAWAQADAAFHRELVRLGQNKRARTIVAMMTDQVRRARAITLHIRPVPLKSNADHRGVLEAIAAGDAPAARRIHHAHRRQARDLIMNLLEKHHLRSL